MSSPSSCTLLTCLTLKKPQVRRALLFPKYLDLDLKLVLIHMTLSRSLSSSSIIYCYNPVFNANRYAHCSHGPFSRYHAFDLTLVPNVLPPPPSSYPSKPQHCLVFNTTNATRYTLVSSCCTWSY